MVEKKFSSNICNIKQSCTNLGQLRLGTNNITPLPPEFFFCRFSTDSTDS